MPRICIFLLGLPLWATPTFTNTGSASMPCYSSNGARTEATAAGPQIDLFCSPGSGPEVQGYAGNLSTSIDGGQTTAGTSIALSSSGTEYWTAEGGTGQGTVEFTVNYSWSSFSDEGAAAMTGGFSFNGSQIWSRTDESCLYGDPCWSSFPGPNTLTLTFDEPVTYGQEFSDQGLVSSSSSVCCFVQAANFMTISEALLTGGNLVDPPPPTEVPEPTSLALVAVGLVILGCAASLKNLLPGNDALSC